MPFSVEQFKKDLIHTTAQDFEEKALALFQYQVAQNPLYKQYASLLNISPEKVQNIAQIPFLPIECFKHHEILTGTGRQVQAIFESSGTTGQINSKHYVTDLAFYEQISIHAFEQVYGALEGYHILALLPSYIERSNSSLVYMVEAFMRKSNSAHSGFYLNNIKELLQTIATIQRKNDRKVLLLGVTFALLDLAEQSPADLSEVIIMETGGMKGRRKELIREELHEILCEKLQASCIHAEYGMTELRSQAYSQGNGLFDLPAWCGIALRDINEPASYALERKSGVINMIDLANVESCAFIATQDLATKTAHQQFRILGRMDNSDIRGCNLMIY